MVRKLPNVVFWCQSANIPTMAVPNTGHPNPFTFIPYSGEHIDYGTLQIGFKVDENLTNYVELVNWMRGLAFPEDTSEHRALVDAGHGQVGQGIFSDVSLFILTNLKNPNVEVTFRDAFPISIGELQFKTTDDDVINMNCTAEFRYTLFDVATIPKG